jgi:pimeloyl-ACP methyl ester carboxylesterase
MRKLLTTSVAILACLAPLTAVALPDANTIEFSNCTLALPGSSVTAEAQCGFIEVPENPADPNGRTIPIHVAIAGATSTDTAPDPVFFFAGGPGQAATETWPMIRGTLDRIRKKRDIVMIDQRGTGRSNKLQCMPEDAEDLNAEIDLERLAEQTRGCLETLDGAPRFYTTTIAMQDYERVRQAMGYEMINLVGVSYGTRAAQVYLRQYPEHVRSVTLDSVLPMQLALGQEHAPMLDRAVARVFEDCAQDPGCSDRYTGSIELLRSLVADLREEPLWITIVNPVSGEDQELRVTAETLAVAIRFLSYSSETQATLPLLMHEAVSLGRLDRLATQALLVMSGLNDMLARGMELSVMCAEDYPFLDPSADGAGTLLGPIFLQAIRAQCEVWPRGEVADGFHDPVTASVPVLLMSGERDPVTPPHYATQVAETFSNSLALVARGQSHSVMKHACLRKVTTAFIEQGRVDGLDTSCVEQILPAPFFTSLLGPDP